jgi:hypothetical protein
MRRLLARSADRIRPFVPELSDVLGVAGAVVLLRGVSLVYVPAAWILCGLLVLGAGVLLARQERR